jgi:ABC-type transport system involved in multi-copper enzyme maturation permease subunit
MLRALWWKEWRELRLLRWAGIAIGAILPALFLASAEAGVRGWLPFGRVSSYSTRTILMDLVPRVLALGLWPLMALMVTAEAFAGGRAVGTENFLLERPVRRRRIWWTRLLAASGSTSTIAAGTLALWVAWATLLTGPGTSGWAPSLRMLALGGLALALTALVSGTLAASFLASPVAAVLLGVVLGAVPFILSGLLGGLFPYATCRGVSIGVVVPWLVLGGYLVGSFVMLCRGEPAGRGRWARGLIALAVTLVLVPVVFAVSAFSAIVWSAGRLKLGATAVPSPAGTSVVVHDWSTDSAWLTELASGRRLRFFNPPTQDFAWNADGSVLAVATLSGTLGSLSSSGRVELYDPRGNRIRSIPLPDKLLPWDVRWVGERLALFYGLFLREKEAGLLVVNPHTGAMHAIPLSLGRYGTWSVVGPTVGGELYLARATEEPLPRMDRFLAYAVHRVDLDRGRIESEPLVQDAGWPSLAARRLSPTGRYWLVDRNRRRDETRPILDLETGREVEGLLVGRGAWLRDDRWCRSASTAG